MLDINETKKLEIIGGVPLRARAYFIAECLRETGSLKKTLFCLVEHEKEIDGFVASLKAFDPAFNPLVFPEWDCLSYDKVSPSTKIMAQRLATLSHLLKNPCRTVVTTAKSLSQLILPKEALSQATLDIKKGETIKREKLLKALSSNGYVRADTVRNIGEYAIRGSLIDLYPAGHPLPVRIDFFDEEVESIKTFSPETQTTESEKESFSLAPVSEVVLTPKAIEDFRHNYRTLFGTPAQSDPLYQAISNDLPFQGMEHWLPLFYEMPLQKLTDYSVNFTVLYSPRDWDGLESFSEKTKDAYRFRKENLKTDLYRPLSPPSLRLSESNLKKVLAEGERIELSSFSPKGAQDFGVRVLHAFTSEKGNKKNAYKLLKDHLQKASKKVILASSTLGSLEVIKKTLEGLSIDVKEKPWSEIEKSDEKGPFLTVLPLSQGFETENFQLITEEDLYGEKLVRKRAITRKSKKRNLLEVSQFQEGDFLIHEEHGIGKYQGLVILAIQEANHDCVCLSYEEGDKLYVPVENLNILSFYASKSSPTNLDKLGSASWQKRKARAKKKIKEIAEKLSKIAAQRQMASANPYIPEASFKDFCDRFPYCETEDQMRTIQEVLEDLSKDSPMDRLVCGDVGFGKTEVALRASFIVAAQRSQVAILSPTTILARQHFETFQQRFQGFPLKIALISRFQSPAESQKIRKSVENGEIDIVIGTHSLLSTQTKFKDLGLLIIDEEQHFGVAQKEKIKSLYPQAHVLSLSATPIPRTLQMAVTGIRELSLMTTPPVERLPVHTWVAPYDTLTIKEALIRERDRGGQSFFVCPRVSDISDMHHKLKELLPDFKIAVAHGQLLPKNLEKVMVDFCDRKFDILIATNIIESGLDIPSANTLIVHRSDLFGLAQIYQLRGRVGRSKQQGYAYFTFSPDKTITATAERRLEVLQSLKSLGGSFQIASHDMDIRGMGNIVGEEQSGQVKDVGVGLYHHMLEEALIELKADPDAQIMTQSEWTPQINLGLEILIPNSYISDDTLRFSLYKRISEMTEKEDIDAFKVEMIDRFGPLPQESQNLIETIFLRNLCKQLSIQKVDAGPKGVLVTFYKDTFSDSEKMMRFIGNSHGTVKARPDQKLVILNGWGSPIQIMMGMIKILTKLMEA